MKKIIFTTHNQGKAKEIRKQLENNYSVETLSDISWNEEIPETGNTLAENALIKAKTVFDQTNIACFSDDSGLLIDALNDAPGVYSARYAGEPSNSERNMDKVLENLKEIQNRKAKFQTVICYYDAQGATYFYGEVKGEITKERQGIDGFGYDPIFRPLGEEKTFAQMTASEKQNISHRGQAVKKLLEFLKK